MGQGRIAARGAAINMMAIAIRMFLNVIVTLPILARMLGPDIFGLAAMAMTLIMFLSVFGDIGIAPALVRTRDTSRALWSTASWTTLCIGLTLTLIAYVSAPFLAAFYGEPQVTPLARALAGAIGLQVVYSVPIAWLQREQRLATIAIIDIVSVVISSVIALGLAFSGAGVWAIIGQQLSIPVVKCLLAVITAKVPLDRRYEWKTIEPIIGFSIWMTASTFVTFLNRQSDKLLIGRYFGTDALGLYSRAYQLVQLPNQIISQGIGFAAYPAMAKVQDDRVWLGLLYMKLTGAVSIFAIPTAAFLCVAAEPLILVLLGPKWIEIAQTFSLLAMVGAVQALNSTATNVQKALGRGNRMFFWTLVRLFFFLPSFGLGIYLGSTEWLAAVYLGAHLFLLPFFQKEVAGIVNLRLGDVMKMWVPSIVSSGVMAAVILAVDYFFTGNPFIKLFLLILFGTIAFFGAMMCFFRPFTERNLAYLSHFRKKVA